MELWDGGAIEKIGSQFGHLLMINDHTLNITREKFARMCMEIHLAKPLKREFWIGSKDDLVTVAIFNKKLLVFSFKYGKNYHRKANYDSNLGSPTNLGEVVNHEVMPMDD